MRAVDRVLRRAVAPAPSFAVRPFGTTPSDAAAGEAAAAASTGGSATTTNMTSGRPRVSKTSGELINGGGEIF